MEDRVSLLSVIGPIFVGAVAILLSLAPAGFGPAAFVGPHYLLVVLAIWQQRRPAAAPPALIFVLGLAHDLLRDGPVGAELLALLIVTEALRAMTSRVSKPGFLVEWFRFIMAAAAFELIVWLLLAVAYAPTPPLGALAERLGSGVLLYPLAALLLQQLFSLKPEERRFAHVAPTRRR